VGSALQVKPHVDTIVEVLPQFLHVLGETNDPQNTQGNDDNDENDSGADLGFHE
jgi:hypothetical protein